MSRSACDQCKVILMIIINDNNNNKLHTFVSRKQYLNFQGVGLLLHVKTLYNQLVQMNKFSEIYLNTFYIGVTSEIKLSPSSKTLNHVHVVNVSR